MSGHSSTGELEEIDRKALVDADNKNVLVLNLSFDDKDKNNSKKDFFKKYFKEVGADNVSFVDHGTNGQEAGELFRETGLLYLPGGDTLTLLSNLRDRGLVGLIFSFPGVISGNSAGAYALCPEYLRVGYGNVETHRSFGIVDFWVKAHYDPKFDADLRNLSSDKSVYAIKDGSAVVVGDELEFIGNIWKFADKRKLKVH